MFSPTSEQLPAFSRVMKTLEEGMPFLMKGLDEVSRIHLFIRGQSLRCRMVCQLTAFAVAVLAFKSVYGLEMTRRSNEKKVVALYVEMKDMIYVLLQYVSGLLRRLDVTV